MPIPGNSIRGDSDLIHESTVNSQSGAADCLPFFSLLLTLATSVNQVEKEGRKDTSSEMAQGFFSLNHSKAQSQWLYVHVAQQKKIFCYGENEENNEMPYINAEQAGNV